MLTPLTQQQQWLFQDRLSFAVSESELTIRKQGYQLSQELFHAARRFDGGPICISITSHAHIRTIYTVFNSLIHRCRFNLKNIEATSSKSRNELKKKKEIKDVEKQYRNKGKRVAELLRQGEDQEEHWRVVLNFKNIGESILKAHVFLHHLLQLNFDLLKEGAAHLRDQTLPPTLQIHICLTVIDILTLINTMRLFLLPSLQQEDKTPDSKSKLQLEERKMLEDILDNSDENGVLAVGRKLDIGRFCETIKRIVGGMEAEKQTQKIWESVFRIKLKFLVDGQGLWRRKHDATAIKQLILYWGQVYIKHFKHPNQNSPKLIDFSHCFKQHRCLFSYCLQQAQRKEESIQQVADYLRLIQTIWVSIDKAAASNIYWEELALIVSKKITLPLSFITQSRNFILPIAQHIIGEFSSVNNLAYLEKLRSWANQLGHHLLSLKINEEIVEHYLMQEHTAARLLLTERNALNQALDDISKVISEVGDDKLLGNIKIITEKMIAGVKQVEYKMEPQYQVQVIEKLYEIYPTEESLIGEIEHFMQLAQFFTRNDVTIEELEECRNFYAHKRESQVQQKLLSQQITREDQTPTCLLDAIKTLTFELILNIKLDQSNKQLYRLKKMIYKLLQIYRKQQKKQNPRAEQNQEEEQFNRVKSIFLQKVKSEDVNPANFHLQSPCSEEDFAVNFLRKIFELRIDMITRGLSNLDEKQLPLRQQYMEIKHKMYLFAGQDPNLAPQIQKLPAIQYEFLRKRFYRGWKQLQDLDIQSVNQLLEVVWDGHRGNLKLFVSLLLKFRDPLFASIIRGRDLEEKDIDRLVNQCLEENGQRSGGHVQQLRAMLKQSVRVLENFQKLRQLKMQRKEQAERLSSMEEAKHYKTKAQKIQLKIIEKQVQIHSVSKNDQLLFRKYTIRPDPHQAEDLLRKLRKLAQRQRNISVQLGKDGEIALRVDQMQTSCQSYPLLVKHLIEAYLDMYDFCTKQLGCELYPLLLHSHMRIHRRQDGHASLTLDPYEGILALLLNSPRDPLLRQLYRYPCFPFIKLADELAFKFKRQKIYPQSALTAESYAFNHLIEQMKALSMEIEVPDPRKTAKSILKCPYFWSSADKLLEIVQFKERYQSGINVEQCRRKENLRVKNQLPLEQQRAYTYYPPEQKHPLYKAAYGNHKTTQIYFSIEGLLERQAFIEDIGGQGEGRGQYKYHGLVWWRQKPELSRLIEMVAQRQRRRGCNKSNFYEKTFGSFQNLLRNLRNLAVHHIYDNQNRKEVDLDDKLNIFEHYFPKLFVFLYRWRPFLAKDYNNDIRVEKVAFLKQVFAKPANEIVPTLESIPQLSDYVIRNSADRNRLLNLFNYDYARKNGCQPCNILCNSLHKQPSFWSFLADVKRQKMKQDKDMTYNVLFWQHSAKACNGNSYLCLPYYNVTQRNQFTSEEFVHVKSSLTLLQVERERLDRQIKRATEKQKRRVERALILRREGRDEQEEESSRGSDDEGVRNEGVKEPIEKRFKKLSANETDKLQEELLRSDYVCKYFIFQLETQFPYMFHDLRKERYQWDDRAFQFPKKIE